MRLATHRVLPLVLIAVFTGGALASTLRPTGNSVAGEVVIKVVAGVTSEGMGNIEKAADADRKEKIANLKSGALWRMHSRSKSADALTKALEHNPNVAYVEPNYIVSLGATPNDPSYPILYGLNNTGQSVVGQTGIAEADIDAESAWNITTGSASIVVGVVDTGINYNHPDLAANVWSNPGGKGNAACGAGTHGFNALTHTCDPMDDHYPGHGTHVSGTIGAVGNNHIGVTGVNWTTSIMGLKFLDQDGYGNIADAVVAIDFAIQAKLDGVNLRVLSNSWGGSVFSKALLDEINKAGENDILFVVAAGNDYGRNIDVYPIYPASYTAPNMITVAASDNRDALAYFSNYGPKSVQLAAPGVNVLSTVASGNYSYLNGTSMATPHVSGVAALVLAHTPSLTTAQVKSAIVDNADPIPAFSGLMISGGRLNAARALGLAARPDFSISVTPAARTIVAGTTASWDITVTPSNGFASAVELSVSDVPLNATASFNPASATSASTLTVSTTASTALQTATLTITATAPGGRSHSVPVTLTVVSTLPAQLCPTFPSAIVSGVVTPAALAVADFDRDGRLDVVAPSVSYNRIQILLGNGAGGFAPGPIYGTGTTPLALTTGDFDGDGKADIAVANSGSNDVSILRGNGDGTFVTANFAAGSSPYAIATNDFNGDGKADLVVANNTSAKISILIGNGDATFAAPVSYDAASGPYAATTADFNRDGNIDVAVADFNVDQISVLLGNGDGTFANAVQYAAGDGPSSVAAGDLNGDGKLDLAVSNGNANGISILTGNGDGTFAAPSSVPTGFNPSSIAIGDLNGDGRADLVTANESSADTSVLLGNGNGTFQTAVNYHLTASAVPTQTVIADFNGDGKADLATSDILNYLISVRINQGQCSQNCSTLAGAVAYAAGTTPAALSGGDFNRDGKLDVAVVNSASNNVSIELGDGDGTFHAGVTLNAGTTPQSAVTADFDRDGKLDLAVANNGSNDVSILRGNGDGTFASAVAYNAGTAPRALAAGDVNGDGRLDLAVANNNVSILLGNGDATFQAAVNYSAGTAPRAIAIGDFNRDGRLDLVVANSGSDDISILLGNGNGTFQTATSLIAGTAPSALIAADFDRDGKLDLAATMSGAGTLWVYRGKGDGTFQTPLAYNAVANPQGVTASDFNDDGKLDLAVANQSGNAISMHLGNGDGTFRKMTSTIVGNGPAAILTGDFNRDGKPDLAVANAGDSAMAVVLNTCPLQDLTIAKSHNGNFLQGSVGNTYTITVTNTGGAPSTGPITVNDTLPPGLTATAMNGSGWTCTAGTLICTRNDALAAGASYPAITLTVNVASNAAANLINVAKVSGGGEINVSNDTASDPTVIVPAPNLTLALSHPGSFVQGSTGRTYTILVKNAGGGATSGTVTVNDALPAGLSAVTMTGSGWSCNANALTCTRSDALAGSSAYPAITLTVNVAANAPSLVTNGATVSGGGETNTLDDGAIDPTFIWSAQNCGSFQGAAGYSAGTYPRALTRADVNGDGKSDLVVINSDTDTVTIVLGNGNGTFQAPVGYPTGDNPYYLAVADMNRDGKADVITANRNNTGTVSVLLGAGDGTLGAPAHYTVGGGFDVTALNVADFDADGNPDVAVSRSSATRIAVLLGSGNGALRDAVQYGTINTPLAFVAADINNDGAQDIVVSRYYPDNLGVLLGNGDGTFQPIAALNTTTTYSALSAADLNRDGNVDLVAADFYSVAILLGNGNGTFQAPVSYPLYSAQNIAIEDMNGDGKSDLVVASSYYGFYIFPGNGDGTFGAASNFYTSATPSGLAVDDFNGDGQPDLAYAANDYLGKVQVKLGGCPDLTITKSHIGNFVGGQSGTYQLIVSNSGGDSHGLVTVTDNMPGGLTPTFVYGYGWNCTLSPLVCTRSDSLRGDSNFDIINVTVSVSTAAPPNVVNTATVSGGADSNAANNSASDPTTIVQLPDLTITVGHSGGNFAAGQTGRTYAITVGNIGSAPTSGTVTVNDYVPTGLTATAISGSGWDCSLATHTCTRNDALGVTSTYPPITVTVDVWSSAPSTIYKSAAVSGGGEATTYNDFGYDATNVLTIPDNLVATTQSSTQVGLTWYSVPYATKYEVLRSSNNGPFVVIGTPLSSSFVDTTVSPNTTYLYRVRALDSSTTGLMGNIDYATTMTFIDDGITAGATKVKAVHVTQLRTAVNLMRASLGLPATTFTDPSLTGLRIKAVHLEELRNAINAIRPSFGLGGLTFTDSSLAGKKVKGVHIGELRAAVK